MRTITNSMKNVVSSLILASCVFCTMSCQKQNGNPNSATETPIEVDVQINDINSNEQNPLPTSKVNNNGFEIGDQISFYAVKYDGNVANLLGADAKTYLSNKLYERDVDLFRSSDGAGTFNREFFPNDGNSIDIYGISPYNVNKPSAFDAYTFTVQTDQSPIDMKSYRAGDLMLAKTVKIAPTATPQKLIFNHMMSKIDLNIKLVGFASTVDVTQVTFTNLNTRSTINLQTFDPGATSSAVISSDQPANIAPLQVTTQSGAKKSYSVILPAQKLVKDAKLIEITLSTANKDKYFLTVSSDFLLNVGMQHTFNIQVDFGGRPEISVKPTIEPWTVSVGTGQGAKVSENRFVMTLVDPTADIANAAWVKVGVNGNQTFTLAAKHSLNGGAGGAQALLFEFPGQNNRPMGYPYTISGFQVLDAAQGAVTSKITLAAPVSITESDRSETIPIALTYNLTNGTIIR